MRGISTNRRTTNQVACLRNAGINFIARYYSTTTRLAEKRLVLSEAQAISAAGLSIIAVYEDGPTEVGYFSTSRGHRDGVNAYHTGIQMMQPGGSAIYFAVDYDAVPSDIAQAVTDYFRGVRQGFIDAAQGTAPIYSIGVYGSGACCEWIKKHLQIAKFSWLAESTGWLGSRDYSDWNIKQSVAATRLCGFTAGLGGSYEDNITQNEIGDFKVTAPVSVVNAVDNAIATEPDATAAQANAAAPPDSVAPVEWKAVFTMNLTTSNVIVEGRFSLTNGNGEEVLNAQATSGARRHQAPGDIWRKGLGPLPPNPDTSVGNSIETRERSTATISREFRIRPEAVTEPTPPHVTRDQFRVHHDGGAPGSAGCIAISSGEDFDRFAEIMHDLNKHGIETVKLDIQYP